MENAANEEVQPSTFRKTLFSLPVFLERTLKAGFVILIAGIVIITLLKFNITIDAVTEVIPNAVDPTALAVGAFGIAAFSLIGAPLVPAVAAGIAIWLVAQQVLN